MDRGRGRRPKHTESVPELRQNLLLIMGFPLILRVTKLIFAIHSLSHILSANAENCSCGYYDSSTSQIWTDSIIVYFNETNEIPTNDFLVQSYNNPYEKGWNSQFKQGALASNTVIANFSTLAVDETPDQSLQLWCDSIETDHTINGGGIRTVRQDIFFGTFRTLFRGSRQGHGGSSLSMMARFNDSQSWNMDSLNGDFSSEAWVSMISHSEFPERNLGVNYTKFQSSSTIDPWNFTEFRVDWNRDKIIWYLNGEVQRQIKIEDDNDLPTTPAPIFLKHWSNGDTYTMQGPPAARSLANIGYVRMFFNSSLSTDSDHQALAKRCQRSDACSVDNNLLRSSSTYYNNATTMWKQDGTSRGDKILPTVFAVMAVLFSFSLLVFTFLRRLPWGNLSILIPGSERPKRTSPYDVPMRVVRQDAADLSGPNDFIGYAESTGSVPWTMTPENTTAFSSSSKVNVMTRPSVGSLPPVYNDTISSCSPIHSQSQSARSQSVAERSNSEKDSATVVVQSMTPTPSEGSTWAIDSSFNLAFIRDTRIPDGPESKEKQHIYLSHPTLMPCSNDSLSSYVVPKKSQIDHLAGLIALSSLLVTAIHFNLTFAIGAINPGSYEHSISETWARKILSSLFLNLNWIGPFLMVSTRFLVSGYIMKGNLKGLAEKTVSRTFRLLIPVATIALLEYFLMDSGATYWLEYLPSITWSTWPYVTVPANFGTFLSEILQLAYLIPNAAPQITFNYCTGVLWTIPVQLQGSWTAILGVIMIRCVKSPWKRFSFYTWCVVVHWYALSWGAYFYLAILLTDLEITYDYKTWLYKRAHVYYPLLVFLLCLAGGGLSVDIITQWTGVNYATYEYGLHPDLVSAHAILSTENLAYPQYYVPKLNGLVFSFGLQSLVELSPAVQSVFSFKWLTYVFPHTFTIYLIHGFIFWSLGSTICIFLTNRHIPYAINVFIVAICCYSVLILSLPLLTPIVETLGKNITAAIWENASRKPAKKRPTLYPFPADLLNREKAMEGDKLGILAGEAKLGGVDVVVTDLENGTIQIHEPRTIPI